MSLASRLEFYRREPAFCNVLAVNDHQFHTLLFIEEMNETRIHHPGRHVVIPCVHESQYVLEIGPRSHFGIRRSDPCVNIEIHAAKIRVPWRIVRVFQPGLGRQVAFKLHPVEPLHILLWIGIDEGMQFAICHVIEHPAISAHVLRRVRQMDSYPRIALRGDNVAFDFALRPRCLCWEEDAEENDDRNLFEQTSPLIVVDPIGWVRRARFALRVRPRRQSPHHESLPLDGHRYGVTATEAPGVNPTLQVAADHFADQLDQNPGAAGADRVATSNFKPAKWLDACRAPPIARLVRLVRPVLRIDALPSHRQISDSSTIPAFWACEVT